MRSHNLRFTIVATVCIVPPEPASDGRGGRLADPRVVELVWDRADGRYSVF